MDSRGYIRLKKKKINLQIQALQLHFLQDYISQDHPFHVVPYYKRHGSICTFLGRAIYRSQAHKPSYAYIRLI